MNNIHVMQISHMSKLLHTLHNMHIICVLCVLCVTYYAYCDYNACCVDAAYYAHFCILCFLILCKCYILCKLCMHYVLYADLHIIRPMYFLYRVEFD